MFRPDIFEAVKAAVSDALAILRSIIDQNRRIPTVDDFPALSYIAPSGFPRLTVASVLDNIQNISGMFWNKGNESYYAWHDPETIESWMRFYNLASKDDRLCHYWAINPEDKKGSDAGFEDYRKWKIFRPLKDLLDRYYHIYKTFELDVETFRKLYEEWENSVFQETLAIDVLVPLICQHFSFEHLQIAENTYIEKMPEAFQLARCPTGGAGHSPQELVIGAATHALVLEGWTISNDTQERRDLALGEMTAYSPVIEKVDAFFAAFRVLRETDIGYGQIIARPKGWANYWRVWIPNVYFVSTRAYPDTLEDGGWFWKREALDESAFQGLSMIYENILHQPKLRVPSRRLNAALLRRDEEDSILDLTIGLEALLIGDGKGEINFKLAMRAAALCKVEPFEDYTAMKVAWLCKRIYDFRSAVVHGGSKVDKSCVIKVGEEKTIRAVALGTRLLRHVILALCRRPEFLDSSKLDDSLLS